MALSLQLGFPDVPKSVTNANVNINDAIDVNSPISFLTFIKLINVSFEPDTLQGYYNYYLKTWNNKNTNKEIDNNALIVERYRDFIKDLSLNYTTPEEKQFLSLIDFNDPYDLDIALGFYGKKLREISDYYNQKRHDIKFNLIRNKLKGTTFSTERTISDVTLSYLRNLENGKILYDYDDIKSKLEIEIEELYDSYPLYYDQLPDPLVYDKKDLDYGYDIFLKTNTELISEIFSDISSEMKDLKEVDALFDNKRKLTEKYMSTDFYYLSTGSTTSDFVSGKLFVADNPSLNFVNKNYPTTASTVQINYFESARRHGFFRPSKIAIILVDGKTETYSFNLSNLAPDSLYYFPDPSIIGKNGDVITFVVDDSFLKRNTSSGNATNQPYSKSTDTVYNGYVSKIDLNREKCLDSVFDSGFIQDVKKDVYNNTFGLFKNDHRFRKTVTTYDKLSVYDMVVNGHEFYDTLFWEGYGFNYFTDTSIFTQTIRSGLSTNTGTFKNAIPDLIMNFGSFNPYIQLISPTESNLVNTYYIYDGAFFTKSDSAYPDAMSSDLSAYEFSTGDFYYTDLVEGGLYNGLTLQRALSDSLYPSITANMTQSNKTSAMNIADGDYLANYFDDTLSFNGIDYSFENSTNNASEYSLSSIEFNPDYLLNGNIMVKNASTRKTLPLIEALSYLDTKYPSQILDEMVSHVLNFDIANDIMFIETPSYLTVNKILFENGNFVDPKTASINIEHSTGYFNPISNRFKIGRDVYYCKLNTLSETVTSNNFAIYPEIYKFDIFDFKNTKIFPRNETEISNNVEFFNISGGDVRYIQADKPTLTYNSRNNIFNISFLLKDSNNMPTLHQFDYYLNPDVTFLSHNINQTAPVRVSNILSSIGNLNLFLSAGAITYEVEELII
jgi:hypothetical protein